MKKENRTFFAKLFGAKGSKGGGQPATPVMVTSFSQHHVLQQKMEEKKMTHGETVLATLSPVRVKGTPGKMVLYFCPMQSVEIQETITAGDGGSLPSQAVVEGLKIPSGFRQGLYVLKNVQLSSNGTIQVSATKKTVWELAQADVPAENNLW